MQMFKNGSDLHVTSRPQGRFSRREDCRGAHQSVGKGDASLEEEEGPAIVTRTTAGVKKGLHGRPSPTSACTIRHVLSGRRGCRTQWLSASAAESPPGADPAKKLSDAAADVPFIRGSTDWESGGRASSSQRVILGEPPAMPPSHGCGRKRTTKTAAPRGEVFDES